MRKKSLRQHIPLAKTTVDWKKWLFAHEDKAKIDLNKSESISGFIHRSAWWCQSSVKMINSQGNEFAFSCFDVDFKVYVEKKKITVKNKKNKTKSVLEDCYFIVIVVPL